MRTYIRKEKENEKRLQSYEFLMGFVHVCHNRRVVAHMDIYQRDEISERFKIGIKLRKGLQLEA